MKSGKVFVIWFYRFSLARPQASQHDNPDRYALATLTVSRPGTSLRDLQFLQSAYYAGVLENVPLHSVLITAVTNKPRDKVRGFGYRRRDPFLREASKAQVVRSVWRGLACNSMRDGAPYSTFFEH